MAARFPRGKQRKFHVHCIATRKRSNLIKSNHHGFSLGLLVIALCCMCSVQNVNLRDSGIDLLKVKIPKLSADA